MIDVVSPEIRSRMMAGIRGKNTKPELIIRSALHRLGFRYRLHARKLPGKPDIVLPKWKATIFVHGCFWHAHDCRLFKLPATRRSWWKHKLERNRLNDARAIQMLRDQGWRTLTIYECALRGPGRIDETVLFQKIEVWLRSKSRSLEIRSQGGPTHLRRKAL